MLKMIPDAWGPQLHAPSGSVTRHRVGPNAIGFTGTVHYAIVMLTPQPERIMTLNSDKRRVFVAPAGTLELIPANTELFAEWRLPKENFFFALSPERLRQLAVAEYNDDRIDFAPPRAGHVDADAMRLAKLLEAEFRRARNGSVNDLYLDSLLTVFATHLLRRYNNASVKTPKPRLGGLSPSAMRRVDDFIRANLTRKFTIIELASITGFSPTHFTRAFRETTGRPPHQYVTILRLRLVEELARDRSLTLGEIAVKAGFSTHSHMTATMQLYWGATPTELRRLPE